MKKWIYLSLFGIVAMMLFASCGKEENREFGIDGYVYVAEQISFGGIKSYGLNWQEVGGELYYAVDSCVYSIPVGGSWDSLTVGGVRVTDMGDMVREFGVDQDGNIYWDAMHHGRERYLHKYVAESGEDVQIPLPLEDEVINAVVADQNGRIYLLLDNEIMVLDTGGNLLFRLSSEEYRWQDYGIAASAYENLVADSEGNLYYLQSVVLDTRVRVLYQGTQEWVELTGLPDIFGVRDFFLTGEGKAFINADDALYEYDLKNAKSTAVLRFPESNLDKNKVHKIVYVGEEQFLIICNNAQAEKEVYQLIRTPADELPHKDTLVIASLFPSGDLEAAVVEFNRMSEEYFVVIDRYGAGALDENERTQAARTRLEGSLVGSDPPDLLDMDFLNVATYAEKNVLADLSPYLEKSDVLDIGDYLENVVEGYTVKGRLVCLPISFYFSAVIGRTPQVGDGLGWTFDDLNAVLKKYPDMKLFHRNYMLFYFLYDYYVNTFIDPKTGECSFDSDEFREFVQWIDKYGLADMGSFMYDYVPEDVLLAQGTFTGFTEFSYQRARFGGDITLIGLVTMAGTPSYRYQPNGQVGIVERSRYKDGAWDFLEYFISSKGNNRKNLMFGSGFPTNRDALMEMAEADMEVQEIKLANGEVIVNDSHGTRSLGNELVPLLAATQEEVDIVLEVIENMDFTQASVLDGIVDVLLEELEPYYNGEKSLEEATRIINNRVQLMVNESR